MESVLTDFTFRVRYDGGEASSSRFRSTDRVQGGVVIISVHKFLLAARSPFFETLFADESSLEESKSSPARSAATFEFEEYEDEMKSEHRELKKHLRGAL